jgi:hypothetical protein
VAAPWNERCTRVVDDANPLPNQEAVVKSIIRVGDKTKRQKKTAIGHSPLTRFRSKRKKRHAKLYRGQGKPLS